MKKAISLLLTFVLLSGMTFTAFADGESTSGATGGNQTVEAKINETISWVLVIPADQTIKFLTEETDIVHGNCYITNAKHIPANSTINATLTHTGKFTLDTDGSKTLPFTLKAFDKQIAAGTPVIVSQYWSDTHNNTCYGEIFVVISTDSWKSAEAGGNYTTPVTYTSALSVGVLSDPADGTTYRGG